MIDNIFISIHVKCSNCICIGSLPTTFENSYLDLLSTHIVLEPIFITENSFTITFYYNLYTAFVNGLYCVWHINCLKQHFLVLLNIKINKTINMKYTSNFLQHNTCTKSRLYTVANTAYFSSCTYSITFAMFEWY